MATETAYASTCISYHSSSAARTASISASVASQSSAQVWSGQHDLHPGQCSSSGRWQYEQIMVVLS